MMTIFHSFIIILIILLANNFIQKARYPKIELKKQEDSINVNSYFLKLIASSQKRMVSSLLYTQTLLTADHEHYVGEEGKNWIYLRFYSVLNLDERFYEASYFGGLYTSIIKNDPIAGIKLYSIGLKNYPNDFWLNYYSGFNYYFDLNQPKDSFKFFEKIIGTEKQIQLIPSLGKIMENILSSENSLDLNFLNNILKAANALSEDNPFKEKLLKKIQILKSERLNK